MKKNFEDEFMEIQSDLVSLVLDAIGECVDTIYAYCSIEEKSQMFNVFFEVNGEVRTLNTLNISRSSMMNLLRSGTMRLEKIKDICLSHDQAVPSEIRIYYQVKSGKFNADYRYEKMSEKEMSPGEEFMAWFNSTK